MATSPERKEGLSTWETEISKTFQEAPRKRAELAADQVEKDLSMYAALSQRETGVEHTLRCNNTTVSEVMAVLSERHSNTRFKCKGNESYPVIAIERFYFE